jgi:hypothetical protein
MLSSKTIIETIAKDPSGLPDLAHTDARPRIDSLTDALSVAAGAEAVPALNRQLWRKVPPDLLPSPLRLRKTLWRRSGRATTQPVRRKSAPGPADMEF